MIIFTLIELTLIAFVLYYVWKLLILPAIQNRSGDYKTEAKIETKIRKKNQKTYEKEMMNGKH